MLAFLDKYTCQEARLNLRVVNHEWCLLTTELMYFRITWVRHISAKKVIGKSWCFWLFHNKYKTDIWNRSGFSEPESFPSNVLSVPKTWVSYGLECSFTAFENCIKKTNTVISQGLINEFRWKGNQDIASFTTEVFTSNCVLHIM